MLIATDPVNNAFVGRAAVRVVPPVLGSIGQHRLVVLSAIELVDTKRRTACVSGHALLNVSLASEPSLASGIYLCTPENNRLPLLSDTRANGHAASVCKMLHLCSALYLPQHLNTFLCPL